jgi:hypothetical protein
MHNIVVGLTTAKSSPYNVYSRRYTQKTAHFIKAIYTDGMLEHRYNTLMILLSSEPNGEKLREIQIKIEINKKCEAL